MRAAIVVAAGLVAGCAGDVASTPTAEAQPERARAPVRSCPASEPPRELPAIDPRVDIGVAGGASWLFGYQDYEAALIRLGPAGELQTTRVPLQNAHAAAIAGDRIFLYAMRDGPETPARWMAVDVADPDAPRTGAIVPLGLTAKSTYATVFAVGRRRAVVVYWQTEAQELATLDTATGAVVGTPAPLEKDMQPVKAFCADDRCAVVAIRDEGGGPSRRLVVIRADTDGAIADEQVAPGWIGRVEVVEGPDRVFVQWDEQNGPRVRALDRAGRPLGLAAGVSIGPSRRVHAGAVIVGLGPPVLGIAEKDRWSIAALAPNGRHGRARVLDGAVHYFLIGATLDDGLAWASIAGEVSYDEIGQGTFTHSWRTKITAGFAGADGSASHADIMREFGEGRGGYGVWVLVRSGRAAVLAVPEGDARQFGGKSRLFPLRVPCPK